MKNALRKFDAAARKFADALAKGNEIDSNSPLVEAIEAIPEETKPKFEEFMNLYVKVEHPNEITNFLEKTALFPAHVVAFLGFGYFKIWDFIFKTSLKIAERTPHVAAYRLYTRKQNARAKFAGDQYPESNAWKTAKSAARNFASPFYNAANVVSVLYNISNLEDQKQERVKKLNKQYAEQIKNLSPQELFAFYDFSDEEIENIMKLNEYERKKELQEYYQKLIRLEEAGAPYQAKQAVGKMWGNAKYYGKKLWDFVGDTPDISTSGVLQDPSPEPKNESERGWLSSFWSRSPKGGAAEGSVTRKECDNGTNFELLGGVFENGPIKVMAYAGDINKICEVDLVIYNFESFSDKKQNQIFPVSQELKNRDIKYVGYFESVTAHVPTLSDMYRTILSYADSKKLESIAVPLLGGIKEKSDLVKVIVNSIVHYLNSTDRTSIRNVYLILKNGDEVDGFNKAAKSDFK